MIDLKDIQQSSAWNHFSEIDPFNNNLVEGYICKTPTDLYGALFIEKVNYEDALQIIFCTPKMHYPFNKSNDWNFPKCKEILSYEKLDGSNIFSVIYKDSHGQRYVSYKTRLVPFLRESKWGPFRTMWEEMLARYPEIPNVALRLNMGLSFELYGARNPHLIKYDIPLDTALLFARDGQKVLPPRVLDSTGLPVAKLHKSFIAGSDVIEYYQTQQKELDQQVKPDEDGYFSGQEGQIWYCLTDQGWQQIKLKPAQIELIHFNSGGIGKNQIITTCWNAFENYDEPSVDNIINLMLEDFQQQEVDKVFYQIEKNLKWVKEEKAFHIKVIDEYEQVGINILAAKKEVMRALSSRFSKKEMKKVFNIIWTQESKS